MNKISPLTVPISIGSAVTEEMKNTSKLSWETYTCLYSDFHIEWGRGAPKANKAKGNYLLYLGCLLLHLLKKEKLRAGCYRAEQHNLMPEWWYFKFLSIYGIKLYIDHCGQTVDQGNVAISWGKGRHMTKYLNRPPSECGGIDRAWGGRRDILSICQTLTPDIAIIPNVWLNWICGTLVFLIFDVGSILAATTSTFSKHRLFMCPWNDI